MRLFLAVAVLVAHVLSHEVEDDEVVVCALRLQRVVVIFQEPVIEGVQLGVAAVKLQLAQFWVVEEEAATEIIHCLLRLGKKLVGDEGDVVACLPEQLGEEGVVAPVALLSDDMGGEYVLEHEAGEVPAGHHVAELGEFACLLQRHLSRGSLHEVTVLLGMLLAEALADDEHDVGRAITATVHLYLVGGMDERGDLLRREFVGVDAEHKPMDGLVEIGAVLSREDMLHLSNAPC